MCGTVSYYRENLKTANMVQPFSPLKETFMKLKKEIQSSLESDENKINFSLNLERAYQLILEELLGRLD